MAGVSLRQRALAALSRREHSRAELAQKLARHAPEDQEIEALLDRLEAEKLLSAERFAESLVHRRSAQYGNQRIALELKKHRLDPSLIRLEMGHLANSELERCRAVWTKKFGHPPSDFAEHARQARFLASRGFTPEAIAGVLADAAQS